MRRLIPAALLVLIACGGGLGPGPPDGTGIKGTLIFNGDWPPETDDVAVAVYRRRPQALADFFNIAGWDTTVTIGAVRFEYFVPLEEPGVYEWIIVAWRPRGGFWNFDSLLGCYHVGNDTLPTPVQVQLGETTKNVDIQTYFDLVQGADRPDREICMGFLPPLSSLSGLGAAGGNLRHDRRADNRRNDR
ncbi:MAG: hypothetical protein OXU79_02670 [Gemmatimonadota bacterium]|nr:hypothetical protein [Gemmatimonadota bacterium]